MALRPSSDPLLRCVFSLASYSDAAIPWPAHLRELLDKIGRQDLLGVIDTYEGQADPAELPDQAELGLYLKLNLAVPP